VSTDFSPALYYENDTPAGVTVDGVDDAIGSDPVDWTQFSGNHDSIIQLMDISMDGVSVENYYVDDFGGVSGDTGDGQSFGDSGVFVTVPSGYISIIYQQILLDLSLLPVGDTYRNYVDNPLSVKVSDQTFIESHKIFLPLVMVSNLELQINKNRLGDLPILRILT